jgi:hypothetical protein
MLLVFSYLDTLTLSHGNGPDITEKGEFLGGLVDVSTTSVG